MVIVSITLHTILMVYIIVLMVCQLQYIYTKVVLTLPRLLTLAEAARGISVV